MKPNFNIKIKFKNEPLNDLPKDYADKHEIMSSQDRDIKITSKLYNYDLTVPKSIFCPVYGSASQQILKHLWSLDLTGKKVLDCGCGSGILGIGALHHGVEYVVFSDINKNVRIEHKILTNDNHKIYIGDGFDNDEYGEFFDVVIMAFPYKKSNDLSEKNPSVFISDKMKDRIYKDLERVLKPGGFYLIYDSGFFILQKPA